MKSSTLIRLAVLVAIIVGLATGAVTGLLFVTRTATTESAATVLQKSGLAQTQALAALGPNMTLHATGIAHREQRPDQRNTSAFALPDDTTMEAFTSFGATGKVSAYSSTIKGTDGHVYQHSDLVGNDLIITDVASGQSHAAYNWGDLTADDMRTRISQATTAAVAAIGPSATAKTATVDGIAAFVIETPTNRTYIDRNDYNLVRSEQLAPDGHVTEYTMPLTVEVLPGTVTAPTP